MILISVSPREEEKRMLTQTDFRKKKTIKNRQQTKKWLKQKQFKERKKTFVKNLYGNNFDN